MSKELTTERVATSALASKEGYEYQKLIANDIAKSTIIPMDYRNKPENVLVALEYAHRLNQSPLCVMQNLHIISGKPTLSASFLISLINTSKLFKHSLRYAMSGAGETLSCYAYAFCAVTGDKLRGTTITMDMVKSEGWASKAGSKWKTMPEQMMVYRAAAFFARMYCPELIMGIHTDDEMGDATAPKQPEVSDVMSVLEAEESPIASPERVEKAIARCGVDVLTLERFLNKPKASFTNADINKLADAYSAASRKGVTCAQLIESELANFAEADFEEITEVESETE